tara:strand:+ start:386 stop:997 length:612 start_codon:yes stop_codon:yes gene_type:complete
MNPFIIGFIALSCWFDWTVKEKETAKVNCDFSLMSSKEKNILYYINLARINPEKFETEILTPFLEKNKKYSKKYVNSLRKDLKQNGKTHPLRYTDELFKFAKHHAKTTGKKGKTGHNSVSFKGYKTRTKKLLKNYSIVGENIYYGKKSPKEIVLELLIDDGIKGVGHRKNILSNQYKYASVSIQPHKKYTFNTVIEFGGALNQ